MKKNVIVAIRFGKDLPVKGEKGLISKIVDGGKAGFLPLFGSGVIIIMHTDLTPVEVVDAFKTNEEPTNYMPIVAFDASSEDASIYLDSLLPFSKILEDFKEDLGLVGRTSHTQEQAEPAEPVEISIDYLLDRINQVGLEGLTSDEKAQLEELSK